ncbi:hypothetical protein BH23CHL8_BH23CHL8_15820 [soil metagenome]
MSPRQSTDPDLALMELIIVDGNNLLHAVRGSGDQGAMAWLLPRLADRLPAGLRVMVVLDGHPTPGLSDRRPAARGVTVRHSGSVSADDLIVGLLETRPYAERVRSLVISNDRALRDRARHAGAPSRPVDWLVRWISGLPSVSHAAAERPIGIGQGRPPPDPAGRSRQQGRSADEDRPAWRPGRSATRKRGPSFRPQKRRPTQ